MSEKTKRYFLWQHDRHGHKHYSSQVPTGLRPIHAKISKYGIERLIADNPDTTVFIAVFDEDNSSVSIDILKSKSEEIG